jgi:hypothetical protein
MDHRKASDLFMALLTEKRDTLQDMLLMMQDVVLGNDADYADAYIMLIEERQSFLDKVLLIEQELNLSEMTLFQQTQDDTLRKEAELITEQTQQVLSQIVQLDHDYRVIAKRIMSSIQKELKGINNNRNASAYYREDAFTGALSYFDQKK